ncbi:MAG: hypothetical protein IPO53_00440 [Chitinophagaceae bacterium]|nr:hypothetical protein [Chitinophagaceae bacterium]
MKNLFLLATLTLGMACNNLKKGESTRHRRYRYYNFTTENNTLASNNSSICRIGFCYVFSC